MLEFANDIKEALYLLSLGGFCTDFLARDVGVERRDMIASKFTGQTDSISQNAPFNRFALIENVTFQHVVGVGIYSSEAGFIFNHGMYSTQLAISAVQSI